MTQSKHTSAPWEVSVNKTSDGDIMICVSRGTMVIWQAYESPENWIIARNGNRYIGAAPDLLAALAFTDKALEMHNQETFGALRLNIRRAIAKVKGE